MASVYTVETLLALKPVKGFVVHDQKVMNYLALWRKYHRLLTTPPKHKAPDSIVVMRYQLGTPNKVFRRQWIHTHGTTAGLSDLPRYPMRVFSIRVKFLEDHVRSCNRLLELLRKQFKSLRNEGLLGRGQVAFGPPEPVALAPKPVKTVEIVTPPVRSSAVKYSVRDAVLKRQKIALRQSLRAANAITDSVTGDIYVSPLCGRTFTVRDKFLPKKEWKKYCYFLRKRGFWTVSEHHPYGDEDEWYYTIVRDPG